MSQERKNLKIAALILLILGLVVPAAVFGLQTAGMVNYPSNFLALITVMSVFSLVAAWLGIKGANVPAKSKPSIWASFLVILASVGTIIPQINPVTTLDGKVGVIFAFFGLVSMSSAKIVYEQSLK